MAASTINAVMSEPIEEQPSGSSTRDAVKPVTHVRSTIIISSQNVLREEGLFERYLEQLAPDQRTELVQLGAPTWLPISYGMAHYGACDALGMSEHNVVNRAARLSMQRDGTFLGVAANIARGVGLSPWTMANHIPRIWSRGFVGGAIVCNKVAPKEMKLEIESWECARIPYCRWAIRGLALGLVRLLATEASAKELPRKAGKPADLAIQISWV